MQLFKKLQLKTGQRLDVLNAPPGVFKTLVENLPEVEVIEGLQGQPGAVLLFVNNMAEAQDLFPKAVAAIHPDALLLLAYPKQTSKIPTDVNRDLLWQALKGTGWQPIRIVALDDVWSVMRFRPDDKIGKS